MTRDSLAQTVRNASDKLNGYPRNAKGVVPEAVRNTEDYRATLASYTRLARKYRAIQRKTLNYC